VAVAYAVRANRLLQFCGQAAREGAFGEVAGGVELGEGAFFARELDRGGVGRVAHVRGNALRHLAAFGRVVAQAQHAQGVAQTREAHADAPLGHGLGALLRQRPPGEVEHVVERAHLQRHGFFEGGKVERGHAVEAERMAHEARQDDGAEVAAAVGRQGLLAAVVHDEAVGIEGVHVGHGDVEHVFAAVVDQGFDRGNEALAVQGAAVAG
jgi:hypothetical protein